MSTAAGLLEFIMLICFGFSWPVNIAKLLRSKPTKGTSILFYTLVLIGYICGIVSKICIILASDCVWYEAVKWYVIAIYCVNALMVSAGIIVWLRNKRLEKKIETLLKP